LKRVVILNDFVANGYGVIGLKESEVVSIFKPINLEWFDDSVKLVLGVGTGLGGCQLTR
jgi:glucokinase